MNSSNSSKPPSSDGLKRKPKSLRRKNTGRRPGGQPGHPGQTLQKSPAPDITHSIALDRCPDCGADLRDEPVASEETRQIFDLPPIAIEVSEYRAEAAISSPTSGDHTIRSSNAGTPEATPTCYGNSPHFPKLASAGPKDSSRHSWP